ncbi:MAG: histidine phosphatase family protein [Butyrivibrio sp.]|nr:histidine phosphatase family protein [Butyrivibrio sp.]
MRLLFIRHGDPDYEHDTLTEKGKVEAALLAKRIKDFNIDDVYVSPLGRAQATARYSLDVLQKEAKTMDWLKEFPAEFDPNVYPDARKAFPEYPINKETGKYNKHGIWDIYPSYYGQHRELFDRDGFRESDIAKAGDTCEVYDYVTGEFDKLLAEYGYERDGDIYHVTKANDKVIAFFCHFGISSVLLSHLWNVSPFVPLQYLAMLPTSVTEIVTEERQEGIATFRTLRIGDLTHLTMGGEEPSFSARYCEMFTNTDERH